MSSLCADITTPGTYWRFCPSLPAAYVLTVCFAIVSIAHIAQAIIHKRAYCWVIIVASLCQLVAYIFRILSILNPANFPDYAVWFILILVAPIFTNAFAYMVLGRMVWNFVPKGKVLGVSAWRIGIIFVILDIVAFIIQLIAAAIASNIRKNSPEQVLNALHLYMIGVGIQQAFIIMFLLFAIKFHTIVNAESRKNPAYNSKRALTLIYVLYGVVLLISIRIIFRLAEFSQGLDSDIPNHEVYQYCLDTLPMLLALILLNVFHPGRLMPGDDSQIPGRSERKRKNIHNKGDQTVIVLDEYERFR